VLQTLGLGGAVATTVAYLSDAAVCGLALVFLGVFSGHANGVVHENPVAALAFVPLTLGGLLLGRGLGAAGRHAAFQRRAATIMLAGLTLGVAAYAAGVSFNKMFGTSSFVALAIGLSSGLLLVLAALEQTGLRFPDWLLAIGSNALMAWVLQYVLVYYPAWLVFPAWHRLPLVAGMAAAWGTLAALSALTVMLGRRGIRIPI
jgi:hypothetical protein